MSNFKTIMESWRGFKTVLNERTVPERDYPRTFTELQSAFKEFEGKKLIFFDTETTGLEMDKKFSAITQLAAMKIDGNLLIGEGDLTKGAEYFDKRIILSDTTAIEIQRQEKGWEYRLKMYNREKEAFEAQEQRRKEQDPNYKIQKFGKPKPFSIAMAFSMTGYKTMKELEDELDSPILSVTPEEEEKNPAYHEEGRTYLVPNEVLEGFVNFCKPLENSILIAQNAPFDVKYVNIAFRRAGLQVPNDYVIDTAVIFRKYLVPVLIAIKNEVDQNSDLFEELDEETKKIIELLFTGYNRYTNQPNFTVSLGKITQAFNIPDEGWHNALADVKMLAKVMKAINNYLLKHSERTSAISYEEPLGPATESEADILNQIEDIEKEIEQLNAQGIGGDSPIDQPEGKGYTDKQGNVIKPDSPEYAEYAKLYEPLTTLKKKLTNLNKRLENAKGKNKSSSISESKIRIKIKR